MAVKKIPTGFAETTLKSLYSWTYLNKKNHILQ